MPNTLVPGIYVPTQVFYKDGSDASLDKDTIAQHTLRMARAGVSGIVTNGSNGEAVYLTSEERAQVTRTTRRALDINGYSKLPVIVGASDQSVSGTLSLCRDALAAGGDAVLVMVPSFFKWAMTDEAIEHFFLQVADESPLPVVVYNYPGAVAGIDLSSDLLIRLSKHKNIIGTKFTCGNVGKLARVAGATRVVSEVYPQDVAHGGYFAFAGIADFITSSVEVGSSGAIVGAANVFPRSCVNVYNLAVRGKRIEAMKAQQELAAADWELTRRAIPGFKAILDNWFGYGGIPRSPMASLGSESKRLLFEDVKGMMKIESQLQDNVAGS
ncbi:dihydrodipicolinate synthetase family protein [Sarocladium implicatum]|nr:dihydrodipicolinate synthetase family protein [Sarocladium implicatum]